MSGLVRSFAFEGKSLNFWERDGEHYVTAREIAESLGYDSSAKVTNLYSRRKREFKGAETCTIDSVIQGQRRKVRAFSVKGAMRVAMHSEGDRAEAFRDFCLDVLVKLQSGAALVADPAALIARIESLETALAVSHASHVRALEIGMDSLASMTKDMASLVASALAKRGVIKKAERKLLGEIKSGQRFLIGPEDAAKIVGN